MARIILLHTLTSCAAHAIEARKPLTALGIGMTCLGKSLAGCALLAHLALGIADQPFAAVAVTVAGMPCRDARGVATASMADQSIATIVIDLAYLRECMAWQRT